MTNNQQQMTNDKRQQLAEILGYSFDHSEFSRCLQQLDYLKPPMGLFWQSEGTEAGIYIVLEGKVRLTDRAGELLSTLAPGDSFGECRFFPDESFSFYAARASRRVELAYIPAELLCSLVRKHPQIQDHLYRRAREFEAKYFGNSPSKAEPVTSMVADDSIEEWRDRPQRRPKISKAYFPNPSQKVGHLLQRIVRRYPFYAQQSASDCGATCLVMVARYWGKTFSLNRLRDICNVDRNGASLRGLSAAAESIGFSTRPVKASLDQLACQQLPAIAHWEGKHYIVVYEVTAKQVIVCDPAIGQRTLTHAEFNADWTNYALLLTPTTLLNEAQEATTPFWQFFELVKPHSLVIFEVFVASLLIQIFGLITPLFTQLLLDRVVVQGSSLTLATVGLGMLIFGLFRVAMTGLRQYLLDHTANRVNLTLIVGFIRHTFRLPLSFFESRYVGDIMSRVQENQKIQRFLTGEALSILLDLLTVFVYIGLMFWYSWKMALLALVIVPPFFILALIATPFLRRISREIFNAFAVENSYLIESLTGVRTVKSMAVEQTVRWRWEEHLLQSIKKMFSGQVIGNRLQIFSSTIETLVTTGLLWFGAWLVIQNELTIGQLVAFNMLLGNVINPFERLTVLWNQLQEVLIAVERINDVIDTDPEEDLQSSVR
ncbi:MAG: peptidase domain-containing ABC transporter, partial [Cyanobacteriota bacterium]|nr:peptidase domain-containing ABC transporter [Cyanobacteriota bacterium]